MQPSARIAILDVSKGERDRELVDELVKRLLRDGLAVDEALGWPAEQIARELPAVRALVIVCSAGLQAFLDESTWAQAIIDYVRRFAEPGSSKVFPVLLGDDTERLIPAFLVGLPFIRVPDGYDVLREAIEHGRMPPARAEATSKRGSTSKRGPAASSAPHAPQAKTSEVPEPPLATKGSEPPPEPQAASEPSAPARSGPSDLRRLRLVREFVSGPLSKAQDEFSAHYRRDDDGTQVEASALEPHVALALRTAAVLAGDAPIDARSLLLAIGLVAQADQTRGAFDQLRRLLPVALPPPPDPERVREAGPTFALREALASALDHPLEHLPSDTPKLWGRDLVTAALLTRGDPSLPQLAAEADTTVPELQDRWYAYLTRGDAHRSPEQWQQWWQAAGVPLPSERGVRAGVLAESVKGKDALGIEADVSAFARLIADAKTSPPLSIGLIGDWGSGKSFFMEQVYAQVEALEGSGPGLCQQVVQIRFSAWHYSDTNIWASLVGHIFDQVWAQMCPRPDDEQARAEVREQLKVAHGAVFEAESEVDRAREQLERVRRDERKALEALAIRHFVTAEATAALQGLAAEVGWTAPLRSIVDLEQARDELRTQATRTHTVLEAALRGPALRSGLLWIAGITLASIGLAVLAGWLAPQDWVQRTVRILAAAGGTVASLVAAVAAPLTKARGLLRSLTTKVGEAIDEYEAKVERARHSEEGKALVERSDQARQELDHLRARADAARERLAELERRRASLDPARRLTAFLESRANTDDYRSQQGIISLVRSDFERLQELMQSWRTEGGTPPDGVQPVDRIVLYIDDLDRCSPPLVVRTLEAIHLLLALELFVVVVAVDSRWLLRALVVHYDDLLGARDDEEYRVSTPHNYLEKIFQITFAVAPMTEVGFGRYVDFLSGHEEGDAPPVPAASTTAPAEPGATPSSSGSGEGAEAGRVASDEPRASSEAQAEREPQAPTEAGAAREAGTETEVAAAAEDVTRPLSISDAERLFLRRLHGMVATPRLVKRLVNVFRLVKSRVPPAELGDFEAEGTGRHRPILLLLAILYGRPDLSLELFRALCEGTLRGEEDTEPFHAVLHRRGHEALAVWVHAVAPDITVAACEAESYPLARFSLVTGQHWHTWQHAGPEPGPAA